MQMVTGEKCLDNNCIMPWDERVSAHSCMHHHISGLRDIFLSFFVSIRSHMGKNNQRIFTIDTAFCKEKIVFRYSQLPVRTPMATLHVQMSKILIAFYYKAQIRQWIFMLKIILQLFVTNTL